MLPEFLRYLKDNGYHVVHIVPASAAQTAQPQVLHRIARNRKINAPFMAGSLELVSPESGSLQLRNSCPESCLAADRGSRPEPDFAMAIRLETNGRRNAQ